jgi:hypothetical protein
MFDDLRNVADDQSGFTNESDADLESMLEKKSTKKGQGFNFGGKTFLGMNAFQRFMISALLFLLVCILGAMLVMVSSSASLF